MTVPLPPGVWVFERGWLSSNNILLTGDGPAALVDTGYHTHAAQTVSLVAFQLGSRSLDLIVNTHLHSDHCGGNAALQARHPQARTLIPPGQADAVARWDVEALTYAPTGQFCPRFRFDDVLRPGSTLRLGDAEWEVHSAPGHDPHSVVLFEAVSHTLISADALWENGFGIVFPELEGDSAFADVGATLDLIETLSPRVVIPGHGRVFTEVQPALIRARARLEGFMRTPSRHARHAAKVLLKFKLLELHAVERGAFLRWVETSPYFDLIRRSEFPDVPTKEWFDELVRELAQTDALRLVDDIVQNV